MPGEQLRSERERRGLTLEEAARQTCIGISYLEALEAGRYEELPNPAYVKGIIRSYARILGLSPEPLITGYTEGREPDEPDEARTGDDVPPARKQWVLLLIIGFIICAGYMLAQRETGRDLSPTLSGQTVLLTPARQGVQPRRTSHLHSVIPPATPPALPPSEERAKESTPEANTAKSVLKAKIHAECQLTMTIDDMPSQQYDLKPGDQVEWIGERYFAIELTDAGAIEVELNGRPLPSLGKSGETTSVVITGDGQIQ